MDGPARARRVAGFDDHQIGLGDVEDVGRADVGHVGRVFQQQVERKIRRVGVLHVAGGPGQLAQHDGGAGAQVLPDGHVVEAVLAAVVGGGVAFKVLHHQVADVEVVAGHEQLHGVEAAVAVVAAVVNPVHYDGAGRYRGRGRRHRSPQRRDVGHVICAEAVPKLRLGSVEFAAFTPS